MQSSDNAGATTQGRLTCGGKERGGERKVVGDDDEGVRCDVDEVSSDVQGRGVEVKLVL